MSLMPKDECSELGENVIPSSKRWRANDLLSIRRQEQTRTPIGFEG